MEEMSMEVLTRLAEEVLTSPDKAVRNEAAERLRFMSNYDHWETVRTLLPLCQSNYLRFIICKAIHFVVSNELGPQERRDMQTYVLDYLGVMRERGEELPPYVRNELYSIYASAIYINWRLMVISVEEESRGLGNRIIEELTSRFPDNDVLQCVLEVMTYFSQQEAKGSLEHLRVALEQDILPSFFQFGAERVFTCVPLALEVCCVALETVPSVLADQLISVRLTAEDSIFLGNAAGWFPTLSVASEECGRAILLNPTMENGHYCARFLRLASTVVCIDQEWFQARNALSDSLLHLSGELLSLHSSTGLIHLLQLSSALLVNLFDRDEGKVSAYLHNRPQLIELWARVAQVVIDRWEDEEEELRQELLHLFFLFGDRVAPRVVSMENSNAHTSSILDDVYRVAQCYFDSVVAKAHLTEDSKELRSDVGVVLHNGKTLVPVAEMLFCKKVELYRLVLQRLVSTVEQYETCVRARETGNMERLGDVMLSLAIDLGSLCPTLGADDVPLFLMNVCLSRLSVVISVVAIAVLNDTAQRSDEAIKIISLFAKGLLSTDDALTNAFLESFSILDDNSDGNVVRRRAALGEGNVHIGVLRALFFFCGCVYESQSEGCGEFYDITTSLLSYVYVQHSDKAYLTMDANNVLLKVLGHGVRSCFLASEKMTSILLAVKEERIDLLSATNDELSAESRKTRSGMLTALTFFVESRHFAGFSMMDVVPCAIARALEHDRLAADPLPLLEDLIAITNGIHHPESLYWVLDTVVDNMYELEGVMRGSPPAAVLVTRLCTRLCSLATLLLGEDNKCEVRYGLVTLAFVTITCVVGSDRSLRCTRKEPLHSWIPDTVNEAVLYDVADIILNVIDGDWCNLGVVLVYSDKFLVVFHIFISLLLSTPVELTMARTGYRGQVFHAIIKALISTGDFGALIHKVMNTEGLWGPLLTYLTKCLRYAFLFDILVAIDVILVSVESGEGDGTVVNEGSIGDVFHEVLVYTAVCPYMERKESEACFKMLTRCFQSSPFACSARMDSLLDYCSAYHRVRLRHIFTLLRSGKEDILQSYMSVFGRTSKVQTLSAW